MLALALLAAIVPLPESWFMRPHLFRLAVIVLAAAMGLLLLWVDRGWQLRIGKIPLLSFGLLGLGYLLGSLSGTAPMTSFLGFSERMAVVALAFVVAELLNDEDGRKRIARLLVVVSLVLVLITATMLIVSRVFPPVGPMNHSNVLAYLLIGLLPFCVHASREDPDKTWRGLGWGASILSLLFAFMTLSAGAVLALAVAWGFSVSRSVVRRMRVGVVTAAGVVILLAVVAGALLVRGEKVAIGPRIHQIQAALPAFAEAPLTGYGPTGFLYQYGKYRPKSVQHWPAICTENPIDNVHLEPLNAMVEGGLAAGIGLLLLTGWMVWRAFAVLRQGERWGRTVWRVVAVALVQGAVSLAPTREGLVIFSIALGMLLATPSSRRVLNLTRWPALLLVIAILATLPLHARRIAADAAYEDGRDPSVWYGSRDLASLERATHLWPEDLDSRTLLAVGLYHEATRVPMPETQHVEMLHRAIRESREVERYAPQFFKHPILRARIYIALGDAESALLALKEGDRFSEDREWMDLQRGLEMELGMQTGKRSKKPVE